MKAKNKLFVLLGVGLSMIPMAFTLSSCGGENEPTTTSTTPTTQTTTPTTGGDTTVITEVDDSIATPGNLRVDNVGKVTWGRVTGATAYQVDVNGTIKSVKSLSIVTLLNLAKILFPIFGTLLI